ncbi:MAG: N-glycosylase/DNA lyase [Candidatus Aenigmatarchaeota archaeon]|nr:N-glycosylase/DNA lyase [Candidatus Aenigmarchaeota archaeon]
MEDLNELVRYYKDKKYEIIKRLEEFRSILNESDEKIFSELVFCLLTPQSKATTCWNVVQVLEKNNLLLNGNEKQIRPFLQAIRFPENKTRYLIEARNFFTENGVINIKKKISKLQDNPFLLREWLIKNVKGLGMKEASHFIRNIGLNNNNLAILDVHILNNLVKFGVIKEIPKSLTKKKYLEIEDKMKKFSEEIQIPLDELDLLLWSKETGIIFK